MTYTLTRVRSADGSLGWYDTKGGAIHPDADARLRLLASWRVNSAEDQADLGVPAAGWQTAFGYWVPVE